ncbi:MAG: substrate-binding domain-containing protein, partial [Planctomycetota bacterium]
LHAKAGLIESKTEVAWFVPVIIVAKGNPKGIKELKDFFRDDVQVGLGDPKACQVGRISGKILRKNGLDRADLAGLKQADTVEKLGAWVAMKNVDASIVWDATAASYPDTVEAIEIPKDGNVISHVVVGLMTTSKDKAAARRFIAFMTGEKGKAILAAKGYRTEAP